MTFAPEVLAQGDATERTVGEVMDDIDKWKIPLLAIGTLLVLAILVAGGLLRPGGFEKAGLRDIGPLAWPVWLFAALIVLLAQSSAQSILVSTGLLDKFGGEQGLSAEQTSIVIRLAGFTFGAIAGFGMLYILHKSAPEGGLRVSPVDLPLGLGCFVLAYPLVQLAAIGAVAIYQSFQDGQTPDPIAHDVLQRIHEQFATNTQDVWTWLTIAAAVIGAPIVEELVYRVFIQSALLKMLKSPWVSIIATSLIFTMMHRAVSKDGVPVPWHALIPLLALGITMGVAYERSRRVGVPIAMHMCFNALRVTLTILGSGEPRTTVSAPERVGARQSERIPEPRPDAEEPDPKYMERVP
ncbi:MAG: lysostaphin resistance A-like protein [Phycisphaerales bacterium JB059]